MLPLNRCAFIFTPCKASDFATAMERRIRQWATNRANRDSWRPWYSFALAHTDLKSDASEGLHLPGNSIAAAWKSNMPVWYRPWYCCRFLCSKSWAAAEITLWLFASRNVDGAAGSAVVMSIRRMRPLVARFSTARSGRRSESAVWWFNTLDGSRRAGRPAVRQSWWRTSHSESCGGVRLLKHVRIWCPWASNWWVRCDAAVAKQCTSRNWKMKIRRS